MKKKVTAKKPAATKIPTTHRPRPDEIADAMRVLAFSYDAADAAQRSVLREGVRVFADFMNQDEHILNGLPLGDEDLAKFYALAGGDQGPVGAAKLIAFLETRICRDAA